MENRMIRPERTRRPQRRRYIQVGQGAFLLLLTLVLLVELVASYRNGTGFDVLRRRLRYGGAAASGEEAVYAYEASGSNHYAALGNCLVVLSDTSLRIADSEGVLWETTVHMSAPALSQGGGKAVAWDVGGTELYVLDTLGGVDTLKADESGPFLTARLNRSGYLAVTAGKQGLKGTVSVYNNRMDELFSFNSSRRFVTDAYVTDDNARVAAVTLGQENGVFITNVLLYRLNEREPAADYSIPDALACETVQQGSSLVTVADTCLCSARPDGTIRALYDYNDFHLREYATGGDGFSVLLLNRYQSGSAGRLVSVSREGEELGSLDIREEVLGLSTAGRYVAVLYAGRLVVYNPALQVYALLEGTDRLQSAVMRPDGTVLLLGPSSARLFVP